MSLYDTGKAAADLAHLGVNGTGVVVGRSLLSLIFGHD